MLQYRLQPRWFPPFSTGQFDGFQRDSHWNGQIPTLWSNDQHTDSLHVSFSETCTSPSLHLEPFILFTHLAPFFGKTLHFGGSCRGCLVCWHVDQKHPLFAAQTTRRGAGAPPSMRRHGSQWLISHTSPLGGPMDGIFCGGRRRIPRSSCNMSWLQ